MIALAELDFFARRALLDRWAPALGGRFSRMVRTAQAMEAAHIAFTRDGVPFALMTSYPTGAFDDFGRVPCEVSLLGDRATWLAMSNGERRAAVRLAALTLDAWRDTGVVALHAWRRLDNPAGARLARLVGFRAVGVVDGRERLERPNDAADHEPFR